VEKQFGSPWGALISAAFIACAVAPTSHAPAPGAGREREPEPEPEPEARPPALAFGAPADDLAAEPPAPVAPACPEEMVLVSGRACTDVVETCRRWVDPETSQYHYLRCAEFAPPVCRGERRPMRYCIDRYEYVRPPESVPLVHVSWTDAEAVCEQRGARLCTEPEWQFACEGEAMLPYPYGLVRDSSACNFDRTDLGAPNEGLRDHRARPGAFPRCTSPFGVSDLVGNVDEWTAREHARAPHRSALHGGWWLPGRNNCFAATLGHDEEYRGPQVGFRCCRPAH
jgi:sulfatase modifying factor 1